MFCIPFILAPVYKNARSETLAGLSRKGRYECAHLGRALFYHSLRRWRCSREKQRRFGRRYMRNPERLPKRQPQQTLQR